MKYQFKMSNAVKSIAEWQLENYPEEKRLLGEWENEIIHVPISGYDMPIRKNTISRPTETTALKMLSASYLQRAEQGAQAVEMALANADQVDKDIISLVYWKKSHTVEGAANKYYLGKTAAYQRLNKILGQIAFGMGYIRVTD